MESKVPVYASCDDLALPGVARLEGSDGPGPPAVVIVAADDLPTWRPRLGRGVVAIVLGGT